VFSTIRPEFFDLEDYFLFGGGWRELDQYCGTNERFCDCSEYDRDATTFGVCKCLSL
jgi:hypothetical protein